MPEQELGASIKYNPHLLGAEELRTIFVARKKELQQILDNISKTEVKTIPQHILITGHRGMGKSTLLQRVALAVNEDVTLSESWLPLRFPEEQYTVSTLAELWSNVLGVLADTLDENGETDHGIDALLEEIEQLPKEQQEQQALVYIQQWCDKKQRRLLLLMDSSDLLLSNLSHSAKSKKVNAGASQLWRLRDTLQNNPNLFWLGGSYQPLEAESLYHDTFLDFFYNIELKPLTLKEMRKTMQEMARVFGAGHGLKGDKAVAQISQVFNQYPERLTILHRLTGGNLRTTTMLYELFIANEKNNIHGDLKRLLDVMTPLYKARIEALADQPRKILAHLFEYWGPISLAQLAEISGLEKSSLSPQLKRLEQEGMVEKTQLSGTKSKGYQVTERFFNIWYLMRNAPRRLRQRLNYLIEFMRLWFSSDELIQLANQNLQHHNHHSININDYEYSRALAATLPEQNATKHQLEWVVFRQIRQQFQDKLGDLFDLKGDDKPFSASDDYLQRLEVLPEKLRKCSFKVTEEELTTWVDGVVGSLVFALEGKEKFAETMPQMSKLQFEGYNILIESEKAHFLKFYEEETYELIKIATRQGDFFPDCPNSKLAYSQMINCFSKNSKAFEMALALCQFKHNDYWIEKGYQYLIELDQNAVTVWQNFGDLLQDYLYKYDEAEKYFQKAYLSDLNDPLIYHHYLLAVYVGGKKEKALALASKRIEEYPTELTTRFLLAISEQGNNSIAEIRDFLGEDDFQILETSLVFSRLGLVKEAIQILESGSIEYSSAADQNHLIQYQLGYLNYLIGNHNKAAGYLKEASANYQDFNLVSRPEMEETLLYALRVNPEDAVASYQLGNLYANFGRLIEAEKYWEMATVFDPSMSIPWRNLGLYYWVVNNDHKKSESSYRNAINARPFDQTLYRDLAKVLVDNNKRKETIILLEKMKYKGVKRSDVIIDLAQYYLDDKRYDECVDLLSSVPYFVNWEGSSITWNIFNMANVKKGILLYEEGNYGSALEVFEKALTFPENLGVGQSHRTEEAMAWFWKGKTLLVMGANEEAMIAWKNGASSINGSERQNRYIKLCSELYRNKGAIKNHKSE